MEGFEKETIKNRFEYMNKETGNQYGVYEKGGNFFMYLDGIGNFVKIPKEVYRIIKISLYAEKRQKRVDLRDKGQVVGYEKTIKKKVDSNCHGTFYSPHKKMITSYDHKKDEPQNWCNTKQNSLFESDEIKFFKNVEEFKEYIEDRIGEEKFGVGQVYSQKLYDEFGYLKHSFYLGITKKEEIIAFEKEGYGFYEFRIIDIEKLFNNYNRNDFGVMSYSEFKKKINDGFNPFKY